MLIIAEFHLFVKDIFIKRKNECNNELLVKLTNP